jgi:hypothetical protein
MPQAGAFGHRSFRSGILQDNDTSYCALNFGTPILLVRPALGVWREWKSRSDLLTSGSLISDENNVVILFRQWLLIIGSIDG